MTVFPHSNRSHNHINRETPILDRDFFLPMNKYSVQVKIMRIYAALYCI